MKSVVLRLVCCPILAVPFLLSGCEQSPSAAPVAGSTQAAPPVVTPATTPPVVKLPELSDPLPLLDNGRLEVAAPVDWTVPPRETKWLTRFVRYNGSPYPSIFVHADDHPLFAEIQQDVVWKLVDQVQATLTKEIDPKGEGKKVPQVAPLAVGKFLGAEYLRPAKTSTVRLERLYLVTVGSGRKYTVELQCLEGTLDKYRADALAVASGLKFHKQSEAAAP